MFRVDAEKALVHCLFMVINRLFVYTNDVLAFVVVDQIQVAQCRYDILFLDARQFTNFAEGGGDKS